MNINNLEINLEPGEKPYHLFSAKRKFPELIDKRTGKCFEDPCYAIPCKDFFNKSDFTQDLKDKNICPVCQKSVDVIYEHQDAKILIPWFQFKKEELKKEDLEQQKQELERKLQELEEKIHHSKEKLETKRRKLVSEKGKDELPRSRIELANEHLSKKLTDMGLKDLITSKIEILLEEMKKNPFENYATIIERIIKEITHKSDKEVNMNSSSFGSDSFNTSSGSSSRSSGSLPFVTGISPQPTRRIFVQSQENDSDSEDELWIDELSEEEILGEGAI